MGKYSWTITNYTIKKAYILQDSVHGVAAGLEEEVVQHHVGQDQVNSTLLQITLK